MAIKILGGLAAENFVSNETNEKQIDIQRTLFNERFTNGVQLRVDHDYTNGQQLEELIKKVNSLDIPYIVHGPAENLGVDLGQTCDQANKFTEYKSEYPHARWDFFNKEAIDNAHKDIIEQASNNPNLSGMGTTIVLALNQNSRFYVAHVGDSRAYIINILGIIPLTEDHSLVDSLVSTGQITKEEARNHTMRHVITQCLGSNDYFGPDIKIVNINKGDILLLCSDGLTDMVEDQVIKEVVLKYGGKLQKCADKLVKLANKNGGLDNITVVLVENDNEARGYQINYTKQRTF